MKEFIKKYLTVLGVLAFGFLGGILYYRMALDNGVKCSQLETGLDECNSDLLKCIEILQEVMQNKMKD